MTAEPEPQGAEGLKLSRQIAEALRFLQHEARAGRLAQIEAVLVEAEHSVAQSSDSAPYADPDPDPDLTELLHARPDLSLMERAFRLRALAELSRNLHTDDLVLLAHISTFNLPHLLSFLKMISEREGPLPPA